MEWDKGVEPSFSAWKAEVLAIIRIPQTWYWSTDSNCKILAYKASPVPLRHSSRNDKFFIFYCFWTYQTKTRIFNQKFKVFVNIQT